MFKLASIFDLEKNSLYMMNMLLVLLVMITTFYNISFKFFFYFTVFATFFLSYFYFKKSKDLTKFFILSNLFILFYFLSQGVSYFLFDLFNMRSYMLIFLYNITIVFIFLIFSGLIKNYLEGIKNIKISLLLIVFLFGFIFGFLFFLIKEPVIGSFLDVSSTSLLYSISLLAFNSFMIGFIEQSTFGGFFYNMYKKFFSKSKSMHYTAILFALFHLANIVFLIEHYKSYLGINFSFLGILAYGFLLYIFMYFAIYLYTLKGKKYTGCIVYSIILHFCADFSLFLLYYFLF